jgi:hypothetical protein
MTRRLWSILILAIVLSLLRNGAPDAGWARSVREPSGMDEPARADGSAGAADVSSYPFSDYFVSDAEPEETGVAGNPLDYAGARIGLDVREIELPRGYEGNYRFACRFPVIDYVSHRPLYMKEWAEESADELSARHRESGLGAIGYAVGILRGTREYGAISWQANETAATELKQVLSEAGFSPGYQEVLVALFLDYVAARHLVSQARANLTDDDLDFFAANPAYFLAPDGERMPSLTGNVDSQFEFIDHARRVSYEYLFYSAEMLAAAVGRYVRATEGYRARDYFDDLSKTDETVEIETEAGRVVIGGFGDDLHLVDAPFIIDLGGDDTYRNNAGGCRSIEERAALCIDHRGSDEYAAADGRFVQGFGFLGVGFLVDLAGDDRYAAEHFCQGAGILGVGAIWECGGDDRYEGAAFCQGAGMFGLGMLLDSAGEDLFDCATLGQGGATTLGLGILSDLEGDDRYQLAVRSKDALGGMPGYGQGGALSFRHYPWRGRLTAYGGVGMLVDGEGNDRYRSNGWCDQGGSYLMSLGVLVDGAGNDHYSSQSGQGSGIHLTNAILIDRAGHDIYEGQFRAGGSGGDRSPGFFIDYQGNDVYRSETSSYGTGVKPFSFSLFIDYGGEDTYVCSRPKGRIVHNDWDSFGGVWPESEPYLWPYAICLDLGGEDLYLVRHRRNDSERHSFGHGIHLDTEWSGGDLIGEVAPPFEGEHTLSLPKEVRRSPYRDDLLALQDSDTFVRFQAVGRLVREGPGVVTVLADAITHSRDREFNRDVMECLHYLLWQGKITESEIPALVGLLAADDEEVRTVMADDLGIWQIAGAEDALIEALRTESAAPVRRYALTSLMELGSEKGVPIARGLARDDSSEDVRRVAVRYLSSVRDETDPYPLLAEIVASDDRSSVRVAAAEGIGRLQDERGLRPLRRAAASGDVYLQRAAARALAELGQVEGIELLIESLSFPSIDAFFNYDYNVPNSIAAYANFDLPEDERYDQEKWRAWYRGHRDEIDIRANIAAYRALEELTESLDGAPVEGRIQAYEDFLEEHPGYERAEGLLAGILNGEAWIMVTAARGTPEFDPETGLAYALRAVELNPHPNYYDTLAEAYLAGGQIDEAMTICRQMLLMHPDERMFLDRLERCERLKARR